MTDVDINFVLSWPADKFEECRKWLEDYPWFGDLMIDEDTGIMSFEDEKDAVFFLLRWS